MIEIKNGIKHLFFMGDIHGEFTKVVNDITYKYKLTDSVIIITGDSGFWYHKPGYYERLWFRMKRRLEKSNNMLLCVRGNHDNPWYYDPANWSGYDRWKTIQDYEILDILGTKILCIGGATSIDQEYRLEWNEKELKKNRRSERKIWWKEERPEKIPLSHLPNRVDIVISHEAPIQVGPVVYRTEDMPLEIYQNICEDRDYLGEVLNELKPLYWYFGHYHRPFSGTYGLTRYHGLGIEELLDSYVELVFKDYEEGS